MKCCEYSAHPLGCVEMETLQDKFPNLCTAQAKGCKYTHVGCPEILHSGRTQAFHDHLELCKAAWWEQLMSREILNTVFLDFQDSEITEYRTDTAHCYVLLRTSLFPNFHSLWHNFGKYLSLQVETHQEEKQGSWSYQFVVNIFYTHIKIYSII